MKRRLISLGIAAILVSATTSTSYAALNAYRRLTGETQGEIKGSVTQAGREDSIMIIAVDMPYPGKGMFERTITVTKEVDKSSHRHPGLEPYRHDIRRILERRFPLTLHRLLVPRHESVPRRRFEGSGLRSC